MSTNPFDNTRASRRSTSRGNTSTGEQPPIWAARSVEWPIPAALSNVQYARLFKASHQAALSLGMTPPSDMSAATNSHSSDSRFADISLPINTRTLGSDGSNADGGGGGLHTGSAHGSAYYTGGLSGFMNRVLNVSQTAGAPSESVSKTLGAMIDSETGGASGALSRPLRSPRPGCVAAANGWIIACIECPTTSSHASATNVNSSSSSNNTNASPPLRLVSRWNVRRGHSGSLPDQWMVLPPPVRPATAKILHVLVDPTASHSIFSASNGECYYIHNSGTSKQPVKLSGFGPNVDGKWHKETLTGVPATALPAAGRSSSSSSQPTSHMIQQGLTTGSYVTSVAWDRERGTEGSSKRILLGTSLGEIYEYALVSPTSEDKEDVLPLPVLLHKLYNPDTADPSEVGAAVTGLQFERLRTGLVVLAATSGRHKRTRFYTFYSPHNSSFRMVLADQQYASLTELPGSVDNADLRLCGDHFGLLTASGIYFGTIDRSLSSVNKHSSTGSMKMIIDSGILPYGKDDTKGSQSAIPVGLAVTPHHMITLSETNEVVFLNRVAQKGIQKERLDAALQTSPSMSLDESQLAVGELMMDIRRPDQIWLRKGRGLIHISSSQEDRDVWKYTLQKCLDMPVKSQATTSLDHSLRREGDVSDRHVASFVSPREELLEEDKAIDNLFEQAKSLCTNSVQKAVVTAVRGEYHLHNGRAELAAKYFAQCPPSIEPFADTAIRLGLPKLGFDEQSNNSGSHRTRTSLDKRSNFPLIAYLSDKMRSSTLGGDKMTSTMIGAWLTELYLDERGSTIDGSRKHTEASHEVLLARFLNSNVEYMDSKAIMKILASHDISAVECAAFAAKSGDVSTAVNAALSVSSDVAHGVYEALQILDDAPFELAESLYYIHAPVLLGRAPSLASESFLRRYPQGLSPLKLLPALIRYDEIRNERARIKQALGSTQASKLESETEPSSKRSIVDVQTTGTSDGFELRVHDEITHAVSFEDDPDAVTKYLEGVIQLGCRSSSVYSYLISLYAKLDDEEPLFNFLSIHVPAVSPLNNATNRVVQPVTRLNATESLTSSLDMSFALRTVLKSGRHFRSAILLYKGFGMREEAVELGLKVDPTLARELAQESVELDERKRLWLMIAKSAAADPSSRAGKDVVARVVAVLRDCGPDVLSIEDVLPYMPDFASINQIKDEICEALTSYSSKIDYFLREMGDCDRVCENLREEIRRLRNHRMRMRPDARCAYTNKLVLSANEPFYVFPSGFIVLNSALKQEVLPYLNDRQKERIAQLEVLLTSRLESAGSTSIEELQAELDGLIAAECPLTGSVMIDSIDKEFEEFAEVWEKGPT